MADRMALDIRERRRREADRDRIGSTVVTPNGTVLSGANADAYRAKELQRSDQAGLEKLEQMRQRGETERLGMQGKQAADLQQQRFGYETGGEQLGQERLASMNQQGATLRERLNQTGATQRTMMTQGGENMRARMLGDLKSRELEQTGQIERAKLMRPEFGAASGTVDVYGDDGFVRGQQFVTSPYMKSPGIAFDEKRRPIGPRTQGGGAYDWRNYLKR